MVGIYEHHTTQTSRSGKACYVTDHASADGDDQGVAINSGTDERAGKLFDGEKILCGLGIVHQVFGMDNLGAEDRSKRVFLTARHTFGEETM